MTMMMKVNSKKWWLRKQQTIDQFYPVWPCSILTDRILSSYICLPPVLSYYHRLQFVLEVSVYLHQYPASLVIHTWRLKTPAEKVAR